MAKYFVRIDYLYCCSQVQRVRSLVSSIGEAYRLIKTFVGDDYMILQVKIERCS